VKGKERVTVREALSHQAGLPMPHPLEHWRDGNEAYVARLCELPYEAAPDNVANYHAGAAYAVLGEMMRRVDAEKRPLWTILAEEVFAPTGMIDTTLTLNDRPDLAARVVPITMLDDSPDALPARDVEQIAEISAEVEFASGGVVSTAYNVFPVCRDAAQRAGGATVAGCCRRRSSRPRARCRPAASCTACS
jgi:CubicO group peptidase (beta-lactamase class C family)